MGVAADEQRPGGALCRPVLDDGLRGGQDVRLVERRVQARPAVPGRAERHLLGDVVGVGLFGVVRRHHMRDIDKVFGLRPLPGAWVGSHGYRFCSPLLGRCPAVG